MSTPAGSASRRWSESIVFGVGSWMSISRLWVRISKCSRESLSLKGERMTQYTFLSVGSGTGPATRAPVRCAVSTISRAARSMASWSYAFRRMRILFAAMVAICQWSRVLICRCFLGALFARKGRRPVMGRRPGRMSFAFSPAVCSAGPKRAGPAGRPSKSLLENLGHDPRAYGTAALADGEPKALVHGDRLNQLDRHLDVVSRHHHLNALGEVRNP